MVSGYLLGYADANGLGHFYSFYQTHQTVDKITSSLIPEVHGLEENQAMFHVKAYSCFMLAGVLSLWMAWGTVHADPASPGSRYKSKSSLSSKTSKKLSTTESEMIEVRNSTPVRYRYGHIPAAGYPTAETVVVDYRDDEPSRMRLRGELVGPMPMKSIRGSSTNGAHISGGSVANGGSVAAGGCTHDIECDDGHPCTQDVCDIVTGGPVGTGICVNSVLPNGDVGECDDGLFCNGQETCQGSDELTPGTCTAGADSCVTGESCSEDFQCHPACTLDENCDDGLGCNGLETCVGGVCNALDNPCGPNADCLERVCIGCGPQCHNRRACEADTDCIGTLGEVGTCTGGLTCFIGRCCITSDGGATYDCSVTKKATCSGFWYAGDGGQLVNACGPSVGGCPKYSSGIAPHGDFVTVVGPISDSVQPVPNAFGQGVGPATPLNKLGDDYQLSNHPSYMNLRFVRLVAGLGEPGFAMLELYDEHGHFIEDVLIQIADNVIALRVVEFDPPIVIPSKGFVVMRIASTYSPNAHLFWVTTNVVDVGVNDPDVLWVNGGLQGGPNASTSNFLSGPGVLAFELMGMGDSSDGGSDKVRAPLGACCDSETGKCSEITEWECEGTGGSFTGLSTSCSVCGDCYPCDLPPPCMTCDEFSTNANDPCHGDFDCDGGECILNDAMCKNCDSDSINAGDRCTVDEDCDDGLCIGRCIPRASCNTGSCCNLDGTCDSGVLAEDCVGGVCKLGDNDGQACLDDLDCTAGTCVDRFQGFGTHCEPNCCQQPQNQYRDPEADLNGDGVPDGPWSGGDNCEDAFVHAFSVPLPGSGSVTITISGDNSPASSTELNPDSCPTYFNNEDSDRGWWESFQIDACANVVIDMCCSDCGNDCSMSRPFIYNTCPCGNIEQSVQLSCPECYNYNMPFGCAGGNGIEVFTLLQPGAYYVPVPSGVGDHIGPYQMHIHVEPCPVAACCVEDQCQLMNEFDCEEAGGFFLAPPFKAIPVNSCDNDPDTGTCATGSCCTGPGACLDRDGINDPFTLETCTVESGKYLGGIICAGGTCSHDSTMSCDDDADCSTSSSETCLGSEAELARPNPCPLCELQGRNNCQGYADTTFNSLGTDYYEIGNSLPSDLGMLGGSTLADDFIPLSNEISQVCVLGFYFRQDTNQGLLDPDCDDDVFDQDQFRVRVYENNLFDLPGILLGESTVTNIEKATLLDRLCVIGSCFDVSLDFYSYQFTLDTPITGMILDGRQYWLEVANDLSAFTNCNWWWYSAESGVSGNQYRATGNADDYNSFFGSVGDQSFCLSGDIQTPASPVRPCCQCETGVCSMETLFDCSALDGEWMADDTDCEWVFCEPGPPVNDHCQTSINIVDAKQPYRTFFNNICADTDGYNPVDTELGPSNFGNDVWFTYTPMEDCVLTASTCATGTSFDSIVAIYSFGTAECPCPQSGDLDTHLASFIEARDENCTGDMIRGGGVVDTDARAGVCYTIRVGGLLLQGNPGSVGVLDISCQIPPIAPTPPLPDPNSTGALACGVGDGTLDGSLNYGLPCQTCDAGSRLGLTCLSDGDCPSGTCLANDALCSPATCGGFVTGIGPLEFTWPKSRFIGFSTPLDETWIDKEVAVRVKMLNVNGFPACENQVRFAGEPMQFCEGGACSTLFWASKLQANPYYQDWWAIGTVQLYGEEIVPGSRYVIQAVDIVHSGDLENENVFSLPGLIVDTAKWGDVVLPLAGFTLASQPSISDVLKLVDKWLGSLEPRKARSQLQPAVLNLNSSVGIADVLKGVDAWLGSPYSYPVESCSP